MGLRRQALRRGLLKLKIYLDANFFVFASFDSTPKGDAARKTLHEIISGKRKAVTSTLCLDEVLWVLFKNGNKEKIRATLQDIYQLPNLEIVSGSALVPMRAVDFMEKYGLKPRDAFHAAVMHEENISIIATDDADFDKIKGIKRIF